MMDGIKQQAYVKQQQAVDNRHSHELRKTNRKLREDLNELKDKNEATLESIRKDYDRSVLQEQSKLENQLSQIRNKNSELIKSEHERYGRMVTEIKSAHADKIGELKASNEHQYQETLEDHEEALERARNKFQIKQSQYEV